MVPYYEECGITIYHGDCLEIIPHLDACDLIFTSPPYLNQRNYELETFDWYAVVPPALASIQDAGKTQILVNLGPLHTDGRVNRYWIDLADEMERADWKWYGHYVWDQGSGLPGRFGCHFAPSHEWVLHFNRERCEIAKTIRKNRKSVHRGTNIRRPDGSNPRHSMVCLDENKVPDSVVRIRRAKGVWDHPAVFSLAFASYMIAPFPGAVLDPFMGSGTTLRAAKDLGRRAIGIEIEERYCEIAAKRLAQGELPL